VSLCEGDIFALDPRELVRRIDAGELDRVEMTWAGEALAFVDPSIAVPCLVRMLAHPEALAREGALIGLGAQLPEAALDALDRVAESDPCVVCEMPVLREMAREIAAEIRQARCPNVPTR